MNTMPYLREPTQWLEPVRAWCPDCASIQTHTVAFYSVLPDDPTFSGHYAVLTCIGDSHGISPGPSTYLTADKPF